MIAADPRPMSSAHLDGTSPIVCLCRLRHRYRAGWYSLDDDVIELDEPMGWESLTHACARSENKTVSLMPERVLP
jgi:hypothetical protein